MRKLFLFLMSLMLVQPCFAQLTDKPLPLDFVQEVNAHGVGQGGAVNGCWSLRQQGEKIKVLFGNGHPVERNELLLDIKSSDGSGGGPGALYGHELPFKTLKEPVKPTAHYLLVPIELPAGFYNFYVRDQRSGKMVGRGKLHVVP